MAEKTALKEEVKKLINSILCGYQKGATIKQLNGDYDMMEGHPLPYRKLGYTNLEDFLRSISDAVYMSYDRGELVVRAVANEHNMKILDLVSKQKTSTKKRGRGGRSRGGPPRYSGSYRSYRGYQDRSRYNYQPKHPPRFRPAGYNGNYGFSDDENYDFADDFEFSTDVERNKPAPKMPTVPSLLRQQICDLVHSYKDGLSAANFDLAFKRRYGFPLKYRDLGFNQLYDLLTALDDIIRVELFDAGAYRIHWKQTDEQITKSSKHFSRDVQKSPRKSTSGGRDYEANCRVGDKWKNLIQGVLEKHPDGIWSTRMAPEFKAITGKELPYKGLGFLSVIEMMGSLPEIVTIERPSSKDWLLFDARIKRGPHAPVKKSTENYPKSGKITKTSEHYTLDQALPVEFKETLRQVLLAYPRGISLGEIQAEFKRLAGYDLPFHNLGFETIEALMTCQNIQDVLKMEYAGEGNVLIYGIPTKRDIPNLLVEHPPESHRREIPMDAVGPGTCYRSIIVPEDEDFVLVYVSNVTNPGHIWVQLKGEGTTDALEDLMDMLEVFYSSPQAKAYAMPDSLIKVGQVCAAIFPEDENWHRVTITGIRNMDFVEVYYVDYGSQTSVPRSSLMMLRSKYLKLPAQAIKARLANIAPINGKDWPNNAASRLLQMVLNRPVVALPTNYDKIHQVWSLCLCDTTGSVDLHINDKLESENLAVQVIDDYTSNTLSNHQPTEVLLGTACNSKASEAFKSEPMEDLKLHLPDDSHQPVQWEDKRASDTEMPHQKTEEVEEEDEEEEYVRNVKYVELTADYSIHIVKYDDKPHCCTGEISAMMWEKDLLRSMLRQKKVAFPKVVLPKDEHPDIFQEFKEYEVKGTIEVNEVGNEVKSHVTIYGLDIVIKILQLYDHPSEDLRKAIQYQIDVFNPDEPYWRGEDSEEDDDDNSEIDLSLEDLETAQDHLQLQRKKILHMLRTDSTNVTHYVDELDQVERKLVEVRSSMKKIQDKSKSNTDERLDADRLIQLCVDEQYKNETKAKDKPSKKVKPMLQENVTSPTRKTNTVAPMPTSPLAEVKPQTTTATNDLASAFASLSTDPIQAFTPDQQPTFDAGNFVANLQANQLAIPTAQQLPQSQQQLFQQYQMWLQMTASNPFPNLPTGGLFENPLQGAPNVIPMMPTAVTSTPINQPLVTGGNMPMPNFSGATAPMPNMSAGNIPMSNLPAGSLPFAYPHVAPMPSLNNFNVSGLLGQNSSINVPMSGNSLGAVGRGFVPGAPMAPVGGIQANTLPDMRSNIANQGQHITLNELFGKSNPNGNFNMGRGYNPGSAP